MFVVDLQTDLIGLEVTRLVAPLREEGRYASFPVLTPTVVVEGRNWIVRIPEMAAVPASELLGPIASIAHRRDELKRAIDMLIDGV